MIGTLVPGLDDGPEALGSLLRSSAIVGVYRILARPSPEDHRLRLRGVDADATYRVTTWPASDEPLVAPNIGDRTGTELMAIGLILDRDRLSTATLGDFWARLFVLERVD